MENHSLTAGAFRDMTRIAAADAELWRDIFLTNRESLDIALDRAIMDLLKFRELLMNESSKGLENWWTEARHRRSAYEELVLQPSRPTVNLIPDSEKKHPE
jgi:prephenate dehydrogenase